MEWTVAKTRNLFEGALQQDSDLVVQCFEFPDRVGHVFWRIVDPTHPAYDAALAAKWSGALLKAYQMMDDIVGDAMRAAQQSNATLIVPSITASRAPQGCELQHLAREERLHDRQARVEVKDRMWRAFDHGQFGETSTGRRRAPMPWDSESSHQCEGARSAGHRHPEPKYDALKAELNRSSWRSRSRHRRAAVRRVLSAKSLRRFDPHDSRLSSTTTTATALLATSLGGIRRMFDVNSRCGAATTARRSEIVKESLLQPEADDAARALYRGCLSDGVRTLGVKPPYGWMEWN